LSRASPLPPLLTVVPARSRRPAGRVGSLLLLAARLGNLAVIGLKSVHEQDGAAQRGGGPGGLKRVVGELAGSARARSSVASNSRFGRFAGGRVPEPGHGKQPQHLFLPHFKQTPRTSAGRT
jgi:hypothetical protein